MITCVRYEFGRPFITYHSSSVTENLHARKNDVTYGARSKEKGRLLFHKEDEDNSAQQKSGSNLSCVTIFFVLKKLGILLILVHFSLF